MSPGECSLTAVPAGGRKSISFVNSATKLKIVNFLTF